MKFQIRPSRIKESFNLELSAIVDVQGSRLEVETNTDGKITDWFVATTNHGVTTKVKIKTEKAKRELEEIVFVLGAEIFAELNSPVELHDVETKSYEIKGKVFATDLAPHQLMKLGVKGATELTMLEFEAGVEVEFDDDIANPYVQEIYVYNGKNSIKLSDSQYNTESIEEDLRDKFSGKYEEDRISSFYDSDWDLER